PRVDLARGQAVEHERVVGVRGVRDADDSFHGEISVTVEGFPLTVTDLTRRGRRCQIGRRFPGRDRHAAGWNRGGRGERGGSLTRRRLTPRAASPAAPRRVRPAPEDAGGP